MRPHHYRRPPPAPPRYAVGDLVIAPWLHDTTTRVGKVLEVHATGGLDGQPSYWLALGPGETAWVDERKLDPCDGPQIEALRGA